MEALDLSIFAWGRVIERLFIVGFSGLSMVLGWNLFVRGILVDQEAEGSYKEWKITLRKIGPGVFFALFGCAVLAFSLAKPLEVFPGMVYSPVPGKQTELKQPLVKYLEKDSVALRRAIRALNTVLLIEPSKITFDGTPVVAVEYEKAQREFELIRYTMLLSQFEAPKIDAWIKYGSQYRINPKDVPVELRSAVAEVKPWFDETMTMERD